MKNLRGTYVRRGDTLRRWQRVRRNTMLGMFCGTVWFAWQARPTALATASATPIVDVEERLRSEIANVRGELSTANEQLARWHRIYAFSSQYRVGADLAAEVYDAAVAERLDPELGFRLVQRESEFNPRATSVVGAVGLAQVMLPTARHYEPGLSRDKLYEPRTNLRIGFRYLRGLIRENKGNVRLALLVYNRGPVAVNAARDAGVDPSNGYDKIVMRGYRGKGTLD